ncbi:MAG TPA: F0F1 ATP synthase subunit B [Phycisphaerae bacterium]|nr:F0F1 ATP synthase subunit B [Phycisphaerae bacterium]HUT61847.1 F0F1 ATP synthase subunit B [Phycisphaerae bacterium]
MRRGNCGILTVVASAAGVLCPARLAWAAERGGEMYFGDIGQAIAAVVIFALLLVVLGRYAWRPLLTQLERRERRIAETIEKARRQEQEAQELLGGYQSQLRNAEAQAEQILAESRKAAAEAREQVLAEARQEAREAGDAQRQEIEQAKQDALKELRRSTAELASEMAGKILKDRLTPEDHRRLLGGSLEDIRRRRAEDN